MTPEPIEGVFYQLIGVIFSKAVKHHNQTVQKLLQPFCTVSVIDDIHYIVETFTLIKPLGKVDDPRIVVRTQRSAPLLKLL